MGAYNAVFGEPSCANTFLLQEVLRKKWNFDGYVTSDCGAIGGIAYKLKYTKTAPEAAAVALKAGTNLNCGKTYKHLKKALELGLLTEKELHDNTVQLFKTRFRLGLFDDADSHPEFNFGPEHINSKAHVALAREAAQKSIVLLKNKNNTLPLPKDIKVPYVTGPFANSNDMLIGSYYGISGNLVTLLEGIANTLDMGSSLNYRSGALPFHDNINPKNWAPNVAAESDVTICVVGLTADMEGEEVDAIASGNIGDKVDLKLPANQIKYIKQMGEKKKGPLVVVIASGSPVSIEDFEEDADAILQIWYPGEQGGNAVADILFGNVAPSGRLPITFPKNIGQLPKYDDYSMQGRTYKFMQEEPQFPFGFGLSYTSFAYSNLQVSKTTLRKKDKEISLSCQVQNTGKRDADEVVQLYLVPQDAPAGTAKYMLKGFKRIATQAGESQEVKFSLTHKDFLMFNEKGEQVWLKGKYKLVVANALPSKRSLDLGAATPVEVELTLK